MLLVKKNTQCCGSRNRNRIFAGGFYMEFNNKVVIVTGGAQGIGKTIAEEFQKQGALICSIDKQPGVYFTGDLAQQDTLEKFAQKVITEYGHVDYLINNALPLMKGIDNCSYEEFNYTLKVGVTAPFYLAKLFQPYFSEGAAIVKVVDLWATIPGDR